MVWHGSDEIAVSLYKRLLRLSVLPDTVETDPISTGTYPPLDLPAALLLPVRLDLAPAGFHKERQPQFSG